MIYPPAWVQWLVCLSIPAVLIALAVHEARRKRVEPPLPTAEATHIPPDGDEGDGKGYYAREQRAWLDAEARESHMRLQVRMSTERLKEKVKRNDTKTKR